MIIRNVSGLVLALIPCILAAEERTVASFEIALATPFVQASSNPAPSKESNVVTPSDQKRPDADAAKPSVRNAAQGLNLYVLVGEQAVNSISSQSATAPIVEVRDERNLPIAGAEVVFQLPSVGPSGHFPNQQLTWTGTTDANGQAVAADLTPNSEAGPFLIRVNATYAGKLGNTVVHQRNAQKALSLEDKTTSKRSGKWWKIAAVAGAGAAVGGIVWATQRGGDKPTVLLQPGTISFGGPR